MAWTTLPNSLFLPGKPILGSTGAELRDNIASAASRDSGAPVVTNGGWHPYNMAAIGDGATGLIYDFAVSGAVASVETPVWADGYEYAIRIAGISGTSPFGAALVIDLYKETDAAYQNVYTSTATLGAADRLGDGWIEAKAPRLLKRVHGIERFVSIDTTVETGASAMYDATVQAISKARVSLSNGNIDAGQIYLYRRGIQI
jgi:hypothetical protein